MNLDIMQYVATPMQNLYLLMIGLKVIINILFAGAVARDAGLFEKRGIKLSLVNSVTWAFATLIGGVFIAAIYWFIHHSTVTRAD